MLRRYLLWPFSIPYYLAVFIRNKLYDWGISKSFDFAVPIICVGNLSTGGTGKTPQVEYLVKLLSSNFKVATLSRGYGGSMNGFHLVQVDDDAKVVGDEPLQIKSKFPKVDVAIKPDRVEGINKLIRECAPGLVILDDAFQHRRVNAGLSLLLTSYDHPFYDDLLLPAGNLREPISGIKRADAIIVSKCPENLAKADREVIRNRIAPSNKQEVFFSYITYGALVPYNDRAKKVEVGNTTEVLLFSGIAKSGAFEEYCRVNYDVVNHMIFRDHYHYDESDLKKVRQNFNIIANYNRAIITTEKDTSRLRNKTYKAILEDLPIFYLPIETRFFEDDEEKFNSLILTYVAGNK